MLEVRENRAHLMGSLIGLPACFHPPSIQGILFVISSPSTASPLSRKAAASDLFDQSALSTLAQRLVEAARRAGADAADAVAVRGVSQGVEVRDGRVEESERSEGDDVGLRVLVGQRQAVVSTNDATGDGGANLAGRGVPPTTNMSDLPTRPCWPAISPISICSTPRYHRRPSSNAAPARRRPQPLRSRASANPVVRRHRAESAAWCW